jgi:enediyne biosynthesis protein E4
VEGKDKPVFMKGELESQMPVLKKQNLRNNDYAKKSIQELFTKDQIGKALVKAVNYASSCIAINNGNGNFTLQNLPAGIQLSSVKSVLPIDINNDGIPDLVTGGNEFGFLPQLGRLDASNGDVLINDGKGNFSVLNQSQSGLQLQGQVRDIVMAKRNNNTNILFLQNNEYPALYEVKKKNKIIKK